MGSQGREQLGSRGTWLLERRGNRWGGGKTEEGKKKAAGVSRELGSPLIGPAPLSQPTPDLLQRQLLSLPLQVKAAEFGNEKSAVLGTEGKEKPGNPLLGLPVQGSLSPAPSLGPRGQNAGCRAISQPRRRRVGQKESFPCVADKDRPNTCKPSCWARAPPHLTPHLPALRAP